MMFCLFFPVLVQAAVMALAPATMVSRRCTKKAKEIFMKEINAGGLVLLNEVRVPIWFLVITNFFDAFMYSGCVYVFICSIICFISHSFIYPFIHVFIRSFMYSCMHAFIHLFNMLLLLRFFRSLSFCLLSLSSSVLFFSVDSICLFYLSPFPPLFFFLSKHFRFLHLGTSRLRVMTTPGSLWWVMTS